MYQFNQMRRLRFLPLGLIVLMSCAREEPVDTSCLEKGEVVISLSTDAGSTDVKPQMKSVDENAPESPDDFEIEIYNSKGIRLYRDTYANSVGKKIALNTGEYRLLAQYGDSSAVSFNPSAAWYAADEQFTVNPQSTTEVSAAAKMSKVKVAVNHGPNIQADYSQYYSLVKLDGNSSKELRFEKGETRAGYIPAGKLVYELYVYNAATSKWLYCPIDAVEYKPNTFVTFNVDINKGQGTLKISISIDDSVDEMTQEVEVPFEAAPQEKPTVTLAGFAEGNTFSFVEGVEYENVQANIVAKGKIKSCIFSHTSDYLKAMNIPSEVDLADPDLDATVESSLKSLGFRWVREMRGKRFSNVDFSRLSESIKYSQEKGLFDGTFKISVSDSAGNSVAEPVEFTISQKQAEFTFDPQPYNAFAKRISGLNATLSSGSADALVFQYRKKGSGEWISVHSDATAAGTNVTFPDVKGLDPETEYEVRAIYNDNENLASEIKSLATESAAQVGNAGFEEWSEWEYYVNKDGLFWGNDVYQTNYAPYLNEESRWWDSNNSETTPGNRTNTGATYKSFPMVSYVSGKDGGRAAQMMLIAISNTATAGTAPTPTVGLGRIFTGVYGAQPGHSFSSRPDRMEVWYKYESVSSDSFKIYISVKNGETVIGEGEYTSSESKNEWTLLPVAINYSRTDLVADTIYIEFISASDTDKWKYANNIDDIVYGGNKKADVHRGSILTIDDLQLIYE